MIWDALTLQLGYNATLVTIGAALLGMAAGVGGTFLLLRKRALVSDAISHATLPGVALAFMVMVALGGEGRNLAGLLSGAAISALLDCFWCRGYPFGQGWPRTLPSGRCCLSFLALASFC